VPDAIDKVLHGAVDLHCHSGPSPMPRRIDHVEAARQAEAAGFRAILVKCHYHSTVFDVLAMKNELAPISTRVFGGVALNSQVGGLNPHAVDLNLKMGGRMIWFPTISSGAHLANSERDPHVREHFVPRGIRQSDLVDILDDQGDLRPEVPEILDLAREAGALVSAGHMAPDRTLAMLTEAHHRGLTRLLVSHPNYVLNAGTGDVQKFVALGAVIEHCVIMYDDEERFFPFQTLLDWIDLIGPEHTSLGSDLGQVGNPLPMEAFRRVVGRLLDSGVSATDVRTMIVDNPARLLGLES
jgi:uncharacterized protein DUF6282